MTGVVGFVNILDVYEYIGAAERFIQNQFGFQYEKLPGIQHNLPVI